MPPIHTDPDEQESVLATYTAMCNEVTKATDICVCNQIRYFYAFAVRGMGGSYQGGVKVFDGAHVILRDGGKFYRLWKQYIGPSIDAKGRRSSHYDGGVPNGGTIPQYEIVLPNAPSNWGGLLFGLHMTKGSGGWQVTDPVCTWFQMEAAPLTTSKAFHIWTTAQYLGSAMKKNVGPKGKSPFTDGNPLVVKKADIDCFYEADWSPNG
jgi:hypothetical protein